MSGRPRINLRKLQSLINATVKHGEKYHVAQKKLNEFAAENYGYEPAEVESDWIIDSIFGGCGAPVAMSAKEFDDVLLKDIAEKERRS